MHSYSFRAMLATVILGLTATACNMPSSVNGPVLSDDQAVKTAAAQILTQQAGAAPPVAQQAAEVVAATATLTPTATPCNPMVTSITAANVRSGPDTAYDIVGNLLVGGTAPVVGRNDANTWWYIQFAGGYAWIAGSVVSPSCIPQVVQVVAAPPLPVVVEDDATPTLVVGKPKFVKPGIFLLIPSPTPVLLHKPIYQLPPGGIIIQP